MVAIDDLAICLLLFACTFSVILLTMKLMGFDMNSKKKENKNE